MTTPMHKSQEIFAPWTAQTVGMNGDILDRMERAVAKVRERLLRATAALNQAGVPYAVVGGNAVASWADVEPTKGPGSRSGSDRRRADRSGVADPAAAGLGHSITADPGYA